MKVDELIDAIGKIDPKYVEEAEQKRPGTRRRQMAFAACLALFVLVGISGRIYLVQNESAGDYAVPEESYNVSMDVEESADEDAAGTSDNSGDVIEENGDMENATSGEEGTPVIEDTDEPKDEEPDIGEETAPDEKFESADEETAADENTDTVIEESAPSEQTAASMLEERYGIKLDTEKIPEDLIYQTFDASADAEEGADSLYYESRDGERNLKITFSREKEALSGRIFEKYGVYFTLESKNLTEAEQQTLEELVQTQGR